MVSALPFCCNVNFSLLYHIYNIDPIPFRSYLQNLFLRLRLNRAEYPGRDASDYRVFRHILCYCCACRYYSAVTDRHAGKNYSIRTDPDIFSDPNGARDQIAAPLRRKRMI